MACVWNSFPNYNTADTKSCDTITAWQEALRFSRQNVHLCRNFSLDSITPHRPAEEQSVFTRRRLCFMALAQSCTSCSPERHNGGFMDRQVALMNTP